jgi:hypothetical protein
MSVKNNNIIPPPTESSHDLMLDDDAAFLNRMIGNVRVATAFCEESTFGSKDQHLRVNAEAVARKFRCGIETAQQTLKCNSSFT